MYSDVPGDHMGLDARKPVLGGLPAHPRSLISAFVIRFLDSIIC